MKTRVIRLPRYGARLHLLQTPLARTADRERVERSRLTWGVEGPELLAGDGPARVVQVYRLTPLGILHSLIGLTVETSPASSSDYQAGLLRATCPHHGCPWWVETRHAPDTATMLRQHLRVYHQQGT